MAETKRIKRERKLTRMARETAKAIERADYAQRIKATEEKKAAKVFKYPNDSSKK